MGRLNAGLRVRTAFYYYGVGSAHRCMLSFSETVLRKRPTMYDVVLRFLTELIFDRTHRTKGGFFVMTNISFINSKVIRFHSRDGVTTNLDATSHDSKQCFELK